jgi:hypothetical protein
VFSLVKPCFLQRNARRNCCATIPDGQSGQQIAEIQQHGGNANSERRAVVFWHAYGNSPDVT